MHDFKIAFTAVAGGHKSVTLMPEIQNEDTALLSGIENADDMLALLPGIMNTDENLVLTPGMGNEAQHLV